MAAKAPSVFFCFYVRQRRWEGSVGVDGNRTGRGAEMMGEIESKCSVLYSLCYIGIYMEKGYLTK